MLAGGGGIPGRNGLTMGPTRGVPEHPGAGCSLHHRDGGQLGVSTGTPPEGVGDGGSMLLPPPFNQEDAALQDSRVQPGSLLQEEKRPACNWSPDPPRHSKKPEGPALQPTSRKEKSGLAFSGGGDAESASELESSRLWLLCSLDESCRSAAVAGAL